MPRAVLHGLLLALFCCAERHGHGHGHPDDGRAAVASDAPRATEAETEAEAEGDARLSSSALPWSVIQHMDWLEQHDYLMDAAAALEARHDLGAALRHATAAADLQAHRWDTVASVARLQSHLGMRQLALRTFARAVQLKPDHSGLLGMLGTASSMSCGSSEGH